MFRETCLEGDTPEVLNVVIPGIGLGGSDKFHIFISYTFLQSEFSKELLCITLVI